MKIHNLKIFISELNKLKEIYSLKQFEKPDFENLGNHCNLINLVLPKIKELEDIYHKYKILDNYYEDYAYALSIYLGFNSNNEFNKWKIKFQNIYGYGYEYNMFSSYKAFKKKNTIYFNKSIMNKWIYIYQKLLIIDNKQNNG